MRYFMVSERNPEAERGYYVYHYRLLDWSGKVIWKTDCRGVPYHRHLLPRVSNNGSVSFLELSMQGESWWKVHGIRFCGPKGQEYASDEMSGIFKDYSNASNGAFSVLTTLKRVLVFDKTGKRVWSRRGVERDDMAYRGDTKYGDWFWQAVVTARGEVLLAQRIDSSHFRLAMYDAQGVFIESQVFTVANVPHLEAAGTMAFASMTHGSGTGPNRIFCYDFSKRKARTIVEEPLHYFTVLDVDAGSNSVAVATDDVGRYIRILVYDFSGESSGEISLPEEKDPIPWFKLLGNEILVAEGKKLKLYALASSED
jgi:hypothetical protein